MAGRKIEFLLLLQRMNQLGTRHEVLEVVPSSLGIQVAMLFQTLWRRQTTSSCLPFAEV